MDSEQVVNAVHLFEAQIAQLNRQVGTLTTLLASCSERIDRLEQIHNTTLAIIREAQER
jgi:prefoldin subunit 5